MLKKFLQTGVLSIFAGVLFAGTIALASWTAHWWGTDWIQDHETISAQKIAENFEYLKQRIDEISSTSTSSVGGAIKMVVYDTPGDYTFTVPAGVTSIKATIVGGGGGGAGGNINFNLIGGSGGGGGLRFGTFDVMPGQQLDCHVGAGGNHSYGFGNGSTGGNSTFETMVAYGGGGGVFNWNYANGGNNGNGGGSSGGAGGGSGEDGMSVLRDTIGAGKYEFLHVGGSGYYGYGRGGNGGSGYGGGASGRDGVCIIEWIE